MALDTRKALPARRLHRVKDVYDYTVHLIVLITEHLFYAIQMFFR